MSSNAWLNQPTDRHLLLTAATFLCISLVLVHTSFLNDENDKLYHNRISVRCVQCTHTLCIVIVLKMKFCAQAKKRTNEIIPQQKRKSKFISTKSEFEMKFYGSTQNIHCFSWKLCHGRRAEMHDYIESIASIF